jgi:hypothetical protein
MCSTTEAFLADDVPVRHVAIAELLNNLTLAQHVALLATMITVVHGHTSKNHDGQTSTGCLPTLQAY